MRRLAPLFLMIAIGCKGDNEFGNLDGYTGWTQALNNEIDILFVVDNSCSMQAEQAALALGFQSFIDAMDENNDFHVGVVSTTVDYGDEESAWLLADDEGNRWIDSLTEDAATKFSHLTAIGTGGSDKEKGLEQAANVLAAEMSVSGPNAGFVRPDSNLLVIVVSDEEDCSDLALLEGQPAEACYTRKADLAPVSVFVQQLQDTKDDEEDFTFHAIVGPEQSDCTDAYPGRRYMEAAALTGGLVGNICDGDWSDVLSDLGLNASGIETSFRLGEPAVPDTLQVFVEDVEIAESAVNGYTYDEATCFVTFHGTEGASIPVRDAQLHAKYTKASGSDTADCEGAAK